MLVGVDDSRRRMVCSAERFGKKALGRGRVLLGREKEVEGGAGGIHRPVKVTPLAFHPDVGLVHPPTVAGRFAPRVQTSFHFRGVTMYPSPHRDVIGVQAPLGEQLLHITVGKREAQVPADRKQDHLRSKLAPLEQSGNRWDTEHPSILAARLSGQASKVATLPIHPPTVVGRSEPRSQSALNFWGVTLYPPPDGDVVDRKSALGKEFFHVAVGAREEFEYKRQRENGVNGRACCPVPLLRR